MLSWIVIGYCIYFAVSFYTTFMQIDYVQNVKNNNAVILGEAKYKIAGDYTIQTKRLDLVSALFDFALFFLWIGFGLSYLDDITIQLQGWQKAVAFVDIFIIINWIITLPISLYSTFSIDKKFGFSNMTPSLYVKDTIKSGLLSIGFGSAIIALLALIIDNISSWWLWGFAFVFLILILINILAPYFMMWFNKFEPLKDQELSQKIEKLLNSVGFKNSKVFSSDASKRDNRLNAYFGGLGASKRVVLFDTLIAKLTHNELLAVLGHELGHAKNGDIYKNIFTMGLMLFAIFLFFGNIPDELYLQMGLNNASYSNIIAIMMFSSPVFFFLMPLTSALSRHNEYEADRFGSDLSSKEDLVNALLKLANENKSFPLSHPLYVFFHYSHPPLIERLKELGYNK